MKLLKKLLLNFQNFHIMLLNDLRLFFRDKKSLILVLLTPFLILAVLINLYNFSDVTENLRGVQLGVCDQDNSDFNLESEIFKITIFTGDCEADVLQLVRTGQLRGAIVIPEGFKEKLASGGGSQLKLYLDNSKSTTAVVTNNAIKAYVDDLNQQIGTEFILEAWDQLTILNQNLRFLVENLDTAIPIAQDLRVRMQLLDRELRNIDFESHRAVVQDIRSFLNILSIRLDYIDSSAIPNESIQYVPYPNITTSTSFLLTEYEINSNFWKDTFCPNTSMTINPVCNVLDSTDALIEGIESDSEYLSNHSTDMNNEIAKLNEQIANVNAAIIALHDLTDESSETNQKLKQDLNDLDNALVFYDEKTENISKTMNELTSSIDQFLADIIRVRNELNQTIVVLDEYTQKDPSSILRPVTVFTQGVFADKKEIFYKLPALMSIIMMFITLLISSSLIVNERKGGTMARIFLSPLSMMFYVFEKIAYLLILCIAAIVSMLVASLIFGVMLPLSAGAILVLLIASLVYISMGVLVGAMSKSENTALLTCLVVSFPLMFMSGAFSPPELMDKFIRTIAHYLPLTLNVNLLESITLYNTSMNPLNLIIMLAMLVIFYGLAVIIIKAKPTLK